MKKLLIGVIAMLALTLTIGLSAAKAEQLPLTTWQVYNTAANYLVVYSGATADTAICWQGQGQSRTIKPELEPLYHDTCVRPMIIK